MIWQAVVLIIVLAVIAIIVARAMWSKASAAIKHEMEDNDDKQSR